MPKSEKSHLELMDKLGIAFSLISVFSPNLSKADRETEIDFAHRINIEGAEIVKRHPNRLGKILGVSVSGKTVCYKDLPLNAKEKASRNFRKLISKLYSAVFK